MQLTSRSPVHKKVNDNNSLCTETSNDDNPLTDSKLAIRIVDFVLRNFEVCLV